MVPVATPSDVHLPHSVRLKMLVQWVHLLPAGQGSGVEGHAVACGSSHTRPGPMHTVSHTEHSLSVITVTKDKFNSLLTSLSRKRQQQTYVLRISRSPSRTTLHSCPCSKCHYCGDMHDPAAEHSLITQASVITGCFAV